MTNRSYLSPESAVITMALAEGAWTDNSAYKDGGSFAASMSNGTLVSLVTSRAMTVTASAAGATPIGVVEDIMGGQNAEFGRNARVRLFGDYILELEVHTASDAIAIGGSVQYSTSGGKFGKGVFQKDATANDTIALESSSASGSIASGSKIYVLMGAYKF